MLLFVQATSITCLQLHAKGRNLGALRVHNRGIAHRKSIPISFKQFNTTLITNVGANFAGEHH